MRLGCDHFTTRHQQPFMGLYAWKRALSSPRMYPVSSFDHIKNLPLIHQRENQRV